MSVNEAVNAIIEHPEGWDSEESRLSEEEILAAIAFRVSEMLTGQPEEFFGMMYRLDISEPKLHQALREADPSGAVAVLIWERQLQKRAARKAHSPGAGKDDPELSW